MARRKAVVIQTHDAHLQDQSKLFSELPAEIRTYVWELVLYVQPRVDGCVHIYNPGHMKWVRDTRRRTSIDHLDDGARATTVLTLLSTCRLIYSEASGIFYNMHKLYFHGTWIFNIIRSPSRFDGFRNLTFKVNDLDEFEKITHACKGIDKYLARVEKVRFEMTDWYYVSEHTLKRMEGEEYLMKKAVPKLPASVKVVEVVMFEDVPMWGPIPEVAERRLRKMMDRVASKLPNGTRLKLVMPGDDNGDLKAERVEIQERVLEKGPPWKERKGMGFGARVPGANGAKLDPSVGCYGSMVAKRMSPITFVIASR